MVVTFNSINLYAQSILQGNVIDANNGAPLSYSSVFVDGTTIGVTTNLNGEFRLPLSKGTYIIGVSFLGYEEQKQEVTIEDGKATILNFKLSPEVIMGEEVTITAMLRGQNAAISSQINASGIVNAVSEEQIQELPDANAGDALGRLPGVSLKRSGGEAQKIVLRGLNENFSSIKLNGVSIPSTESGSRGVDLSLFSVSSLAGIEVTKALTSDMDADAIAGSVNLVTKKAPSDPTIRIDLGGGYNVLESSAKQYDMAVRYSRRVFDDLLGVQISGNAESKIRSNEQYSQGWTIRADSSWLINNLTTTYRDEERKRIGGSVLLDINTADKGEIRFNNFFNWTGRDAVAYNRTYSNGEDVSYSIQDTERNIKSLNSSLTGKNYIKKFEINWGASYAYTVGSKPYDHQMKFIEGGSVGAGMMNIPAELQHASGDALIPYAYNNFAAAYLDRAFFETSLNKDRDLAGYVDIKRTLTITDKINVDLKAGAKYRHKNRSNTLDRYRSTYWINGPKEYSQLSDGSIIPADYSGTSFNDLAMVGGFNVSMLNFLAENPQSRDLFDGKYELNPLIDADLAREWYETHKNGVNEDGSLGEYNPYQTAIKDLYTITERISSGYAMAIVNLGEQITVIGGVRVEQERNNYTAKYAPEISGFYTFDADEVSDTSSTYTSTFILPNFHFKYKPVDWFDIRLAATKTLARPNFSMRLPTVVSIRDAQSITRGNPDLKTTEAWNYDVIASLYQSQYGLLTIGGFYKKLDNIFYDLNDVRIIDSEMEASLDLPTGYGSYAGFTISEPINTSGTEVMGLEIDLQANLRFLPGFFSNFLIRGNFTAIKSVTYIPRFRVDEDNSVFPPTQTPVFYTSEERLEGQPSRFGNIALGYDQGGFSARLSTFFQGDYLNSISSFALYDGYQKAYSKWDLSMKQKIQKYNMEVMLNISNLTNFQEGTFTGYRGLDEGSTTYGMLINTGIRITL